jgi:hypothetical protein
MAAHGGHLPDKIVGHILKGAYPSGQPGAFSREIADLLQQLDTVEIDPAPTVRSARFGDRGDGDS